MGSEKAWVFSIGGSNHTVRLKWGKASEEYRQTFLDDFQIEVEKTTGPAYYKHIKTGKVIVDDVIVDEWQPGALKKIPDDVIFEVKGTPAALRSKGRIFKKTELYIDGKLIQ